MNRVFLIGYVNSNKMVSGEGTRKCTSFTIRVPSASGRFSDYIRVACFSKEADFAEKYISIDKKLLVYGRLHQIYDKNEFEVIAEDIIFVESKSSEKSRKGTFFSNT